MHVRLVPYLFAPLAAAIAKPAPAAQATSPAIPTGVPTCAQPALVAAIQASGCSFTDTHCICSNPTLLSTLTSAVKNACDPADQAALIAFAQTYCGTSVVSTSAPITTSSSALRSSITAPATETTPSGGLLVDTTSRVTSTAMVANTTATGTSTARPLNSTTVTSHTTRPSSGAEARSQSWSLAGLAVAMGVVVLVFAEL